MNVTLINDNFVEGTETCRIGLLALFIIEDNIQTIHTESDVIVTILDDDSKLNTALVPVVEA